MNDRRRGPAPAGRAAQRVERLVRAEVRALKPYAVDDAGDMVKLDAMENPHVWPDEMRAAWSQMLAGVDVNRYPDAGAAALKAKLRQVEGIPEGYELALGNGSDELIQLLVSTFAGPGGRVLSVAPSFVMYRRSCIAAGAQYEEVLLDAETFALEREAMLAVVKRHRPSLIFLAYPNNPTGNLFDAEAMAEVARASEGLVVVDEAYAPFAAQTWLCRAGSFDNVVLLRTLSKLGLAGLRLGFLAGAPEWVEPVEKLRLPYNINVLTQRTAAFALDRYDVFRRQTEAIRRERETLAQTLAGVEGVRVWPSEANFLLIRCRAGGEAVFQGLKRRKVLVKNLSGTAPLLDDCLRVTVGTPEENATFVAALRATLAA